MTVDELIAEIKNKQPPAPSNKVDAFERTIGHRLPDDYRAFLVACNGGSLGGRLDFPSDDEPAFSSIHHIGGFRDETYFSLERKNEVYSGRIPRGLIWIMDDPGGNALCLGVDSEHRGRVYFWSHEFEPNEEEWDGTLETAENVTLIASSFTEFVARLQREERQGHDDSARPRTESRRRWWEFW